MVGFIVFVLVFVVDGVVLRCCYVLIVLLIVIYLVYICS